MTLAAVSVVDCGKSSLSPHSGSRAWALAHARRLLTDPANGLPFRLTAYQLFHLALLRSARVIAGLLRFFRFDLLAGGPLGLLTFVFR